MSATTAKYLCEVCDTPISYQGGRYKPRWCGECRDGEEHKAQRKRQYEYSRKARVSGPRVSCVEPACQAVLLTPVPDKRCRFCRIELGLEEPV